MSKKQEKRDNASKVSAIQKGKNKILRVKFGDFIAVSVYDLATWVGIGLSIGFLLIYGFQGNQRGVKWSIVSLIFFIVIMLAVRAWQHRSPSAEIAKRPELYISGVRMVPLEAGKPETVLLGLKNRGELTARNIRLGGGNHVFAKASFEGPLVYREIAPTHQPDLGPNGEEVSLTSRSPKPLTQGLIDQLMDRDALFFHFAEGEYDDDNGATYFIDYCYMFEPISPTIPKMCPEKYWPKEREKRRGLPTLRPQLVLESAAVNLKKGKPLEIYVVFQNRGYELCTGMRLEGFTSVQPRDFTGPLQIETLTRTDIPLSVGPDQKFTAILREPNRRWTKEGVSDVRQEKALLFHYARGDYTDQTGNVYPIEFCLRYEKDTPKSSSGLPYMSLAERRFWPNSDASKKTD